MRIRVFYLSSADVTRYAINSLYEMNGYTWRGAHVTPREHPISEDCQRRFGPGHSRRFVLYALAGA